MKKIIAKEISKVKENGKKIVSALRLRISEHSFEFYITPLI